MSTESSTKGHEKQDKTIRLYTKDSVEAYHSVKETLQSKIGEKLTDLEVVHFLCLYYLADDEPIADMVRDIVDDHASENDDPVFSSTELQQLQDMDPNLLRRVASDANTDAINGKSTMLERFSYFAERD